MKFQGLLLAGMFVAWCGTHAAAQERVDQPRAAKAEQDQIRLATDRVETTPEMWFYQQELARQEDPRDAVRRKAEYAAAQRQWRIAMMKAQGLSKMRPTESHTPMFSSYLPTQDIYRWGYGRGVMEVAAPTTPYRR